ncbi:MAG TPA: cyanophycinase [Pyrinomonadaceae bacterium]|nr:cyanophycinase [Pyrinomonadaceae bacterium]
MNSLQSPGPLVIIGGAEDRKRDCKILREFVRLAGGPAARVLIIAVASDNPSEVGASYVEVFKRLGAGAVRCLNISRRADANAASAVRAVQEASGVFFTGGTQVRIINQLGGTKVDTALHKRHEEGLVLAGTSAGAAMMSTIMIIGGLTEKAFRVGIVDLGPGMEFISGVLIDQHFEERGRLRRLLSAVAQYPRDLGLGIDENTAVVVSDHVFRVIGEGSVTVIDAGDLTYTDLPNLKKNDILTLCGVKIHILAEGYRFDLRNRTPIIEMEAAGAGRNEETNLEDNQNEIVIEPAT